MPGGRFTDTFILDISALAGLSPYDYAAGVKLFIPELLKLRGSASLWVRVDSPGFWYPMELQRALRGARLPVAVTRTTASTVNLSDFSFVPWMDTDLSQVPPGAEIMPPSLDEKLLRCLRVLARITTGFTAEIAALAGLNQFTAGDCLRRLGRDRCVFQVGLKTDNCRDGKRIWSRTLPCWNWKLTQKGVMHALRSWGIPAGLQFTARRERRTTGGYRHRRISRLWPAWWEEHAGYANIWTGWSEVFVRELSMIPDGLAWGTVDGRETLFWLEVVTSAKTYAQIRARMRQKYLAAARYSQNRDLQLVFALLGPPWMMQAVQTAFSGMGEHTAVVLADWNGFGKLPVVQWGRVRLMR